MISSASAEYLPTSASSRQPTSRWTSLMAASSAAIGMRVARSCGACIGGMEMRSAPSSTAWEIGVSLTTPPAISRRLAERACGPADAIRGADCRTLETPLRVSGDSCVDARASGGGAPDHGAYRNGWRYASAALTGGTTNAISPSHRMSWTTIWVSPVSRSHSSVTARPSPRRVSSSTNIERLHVVPTARPEFLCGGACEQFPTLALERAQIVEVCCPGRVVWEAVDQLRCVGVGVQQLVGELGQAGAPPRVGSLIAAARAGGARLAGPRRARCATTGCAEPQADHGPAGARRSLKLDRG